MVQVKGRRYTVGLGGHRFVGLAEAREAAFEKPQGAARDRARHEDGREGHSTRDNPHVCLHPHGTPHVLRLAQAETMDRAKTSPPRDVAVQTPRTAPSTQAGNYVDQNGCDLFAAKDSCERNKERRYRV